MALTKTPIDISFQRGLDLKSDPKRVAIGSFLRLVNSVFSKTGLLEKRNGFSSLTTLDVTDTTFLTTFNNDLTAIGSSILAYNLPNQSWANKGTLFPCELSTLSLVRTNTTQYQCDSVVAPNGLVCTTYSSQDTTSLTAKKYYYVVSDYATGQNIKATTQLTEADATYGTPRVFLLSNTYFLIVYTQKVSLTYHLRYIAVPINDPTHPTPAADVGTTVSPTQHVSFDGVSVGTRVYIAYNNLDAGQSLRVTYIENVASGPVSPYTLPSANPEAFTLTADVSSATSPLIYVVYKQSTTTRCLAVDQLLSPVIPVFTLYASGGYYNMASTAYNGELQVFVEVPVTYSGSTTPTNQIAKLTVTHSRAFYSVFSSGVSSITASQVVDLEATMLILDKTTPADITTNTTATSIVGSTINLSNPTANASAASPGDLLIGVEISAFTTLKRSVGLASKAFVFNGVAYMLVAYNSAYQPTYFLMDDEGYIISRLAYSNAGSLSSSSTDVTYLPYGLPSASFQATANGALSAGSASISNLSNAQGIVPGMNVTGSGIPSGTVVVDVSGTTLYISSEATSSGTSQLFFGNIQIPYLIKSSIASVSKSNGALNKAEGLYAQAGVNLVSYKLGTSKVTAVESAQTLQLSGGLIWSYDGFYPVEQNFLVWPDFVTATWLEVSTVTPTGTTANNSAIITALSAITGIAVGMTITGTNIPADSVVIAILSNTSIQISQAATGAAVGTTFTIQGNMESQPDGSTNDNAYFYQIVYSWPNNSGIQERSAPSIPLSITTTGSTSTGTVTLKIATNRLTYKTTSPIKIEVYRWSVAQQTYYQVTSVVLPLLNDTSTDTVTFIDTQSDDDILGNEILYTNGGVVENIAPPASSIMTLFQSRMWLVDAEDPNLLWFSKQIIETTPIEMSDVFTSFVSPTIGAQGSTGKITALFPMDDKLIIFKKEAMYYINGLGPDNTGNNNQFSEPVFIASTIGCVNQQSLVLIPQGLIFQSDKGLWLLGRDLNTSYVGSRVETLTQDSLVVSALTIPGTNQVRFTMDSGIVIMYDYFFNEWSTFTINGISSTLFQGLHTYVNSVGQVFQESPGLYLDGTTPVLMSFTTSWISLGGIQGFERFYSGYLLGEYLSPFKLNVQFAYDFNASQLQSTIVTPQDYTPPYGGLPYWGSGDVWGGIVSTFQERVFPEKQKCESFQVTVDEIYDPSFGAVAGAGLTLSSLSLVVGVKRGFRTASAGRSS